MKKSRDNSEKTSRRSFNKRIATALVAAPVLSALSSCKRQEGNRSSTTQTNESPSPTPSPTPPGTSYLVRPGNPPIIIDDGSFTINLASKVVPQDLGGTRRRYRHTQESPRVYGAITHIRLINDYGEMLCNFPVGSGAVMELKMWIETGTDTNGVITYSGLTADYDPDFVLTNQDNGSFEFRYGAEEKDKFKEPQKHYKKKRLHWRYEVKDKGNGANLRLFRVGKVGVTVNSNSCTVGGETPDNQADNGFRVIIELADV